MPEEKLIPKNSVWKLVSCLFNSFCWKLEALLIIHPCFADDSDISTTHSSQYYFKTIEVATNNFSSSNKLGEGGFGEVYKVRRSLFSFFFYIYTMKNNRPCLFYSMVYRVHYQLERKWLWSDCRKCQDKGQESSGTRLFLCQNFNIGIWLGFLDSVWKEEKRFSYMNLFPTKALTTSYSVWFSFKLEGFFLSFRLIGRTWNFVDFEKQSQLDWTRRYKIIGGIARGILYLHQDSQLIIIHRDLKASNILLDVNMIPKISDFGLSTIFGMEQTQGNTHRVAGT